MIRLNKTWVHEDLYYHFLSKFDKSQYENLDTNEMYWFICDHANAKDAKFEDENACITHEGYIVLSVKEHVKFRNNKICELEPNMFKSYYITSMNYLIRFIYDDDNVYKMIDTGEIDENFKLKNECIY